MRRLRLRLERSLATHRAARERGATSIFVALSLVAMLGFTALAIDVGAMYHERAELQSGADAAALAVAQDCGQGLNCTGPAALPTAQEYAQRNAKDGAVNVAEPVFELSKPSVRVNVSTREEDGTGALALSFAPVLGIDEATVGATSAASWFTPNKGPAILPIVISPCDFHIGAGPQVLQLHSITGSNKNNDECGMKSTSSGLNIPGGFGFIDPPPGECTTTVQVDQIAYSEPGNDLPSACESVLQSHVGDTVLLPLYKDLGDSGNKGWYQIDGWVAFKLLGWRFPSTSYANTAYTGATCSNPCTGLIGEFVKYATIDDAFTGGGPDHGASVITLME